MKKYTVYTQGPWLGPEENDEVAADYYAAKKAGNRRILLEWSWCGGCDILDAVDGRGRGWYSYDGQRRRRKNI
jgi:hypothetical protein